MLVRTIAAPAEAILEAAAQPIATGFADPTDAVVEGGTIRWGSISDVADEVERFGEVEGDASGSRVALRAEVGFRMPYFGLLFRPLIARAVRRSLEHIGDVLEARAVGASEPSAPKRPFWAPRDPIEGWRANRIATICAVLLVAGYCGGLFTNTLDFVADSFGASDADLGVVLALTRIGILVGLVGATLADRRGRRKILLASLIGVCVSSAISALAPNLVTFGVAQVFVRGFVQLAGIIGFVAVTEEAPEGSRAFLLAIAGMASGAGFALGAGLLPLADKAGGAWRLMFLIAALGLMLVPGIARQLPETDRYTEISGRLGAARARELIDPRYGGRFFIAAAIGFLLGFFGSPSLQFTNRYLSNVRGYSGIGIFFLRSVTQGVPALLGIILGGKLAESRGRLVIASRATLALGVMSVVFFLTGGAPLWISMLVATVAGAMSGPALTAFNTELFPTEVRGRAGAILLTVSVIGAVAGLLFVGYMAEPLGDVGKAVAITCIAPIIVAVVLIPRLPEARGKRLDEISPPEV
ncbi:MAG: MFS transporter [Actinomycetota bacterium]